MTLLFLLPAVMVLNLIYHLSRFAMTRICTMHFQHYFIGFNPRLFDFYFSGIKFSVGLFIPFPGLVRIYKVVNGKKSRFIYAWEFPEYPLWKKFAVTLSGVVGMLITGIIIFIALTLVDKEFYISKEEINKYGIYPSPLAIRYGFERGDRILAINGKDYEGYADLNDPRIIFTEGNTFTVLRNGKELEVRVTVPPEVPDRMEQPFLSMLAPFEIRLVNPGSAADQSGLLPGDRITKVNGNSIVTFYDMREELLKSETDEATLEIQRPAHQEEYDIFEKKVLLDDTRKIGIYTNDLVAYTERKYSLGQAVIIGAKRALSLVPIQVRSFVNILSGKLESRRTVGGPIGINRAFGDQSNGMIFLYTAGFYAMFTVFWNLLPFPKSVLWEIIPLGYQGVTGKLASYKIIKRFKTLAYILLGLIVLWIFVSDIIKLF